MDILKASRNYLREAQQKEEHARQSGTAFKRFSYFSPDMNPHMVSKEARSLVTDKAILSKVMELIGEDIVCINSIYIAKPPKSEDHLTPHQDEVFWGLRNSLAVSVWIALTDSTSSNGCLEVLPGSHMTRLDHKTHDDASNVLQMRESCASEIDVDKMVRLELKAGQFSIHHCRLVHMSRKNKSSDWRVGFIARYAHRSALDFDYMNKALYTEVIRDVGIKNAQEEPLEGEAARRVFNREYFRKLNDTALGI